MPLILDFHGQTLSLLPVMAQAQVPHPRITTSKLPMCRVCMVVWECSMQPKYRYIRICSISSVMLDICSVCILCSRTNWTSRTLSNYLSIFHVPRLVPGYISSGSAAILYHICSSTVI